MTCLVATNAERAAQNWRVVSFALSNLFLTTHQAYSAGGIQFSPVELQICLTVAVANVQKLMRERVVPLDLSATQVLPREWVVPISRNAIASATGLPRETVRRHVEKLIERGLLIEDPRGGVTPPPGMIEKFGLVGTLEPMLTEFARTASQLIRLGVLEVKTD
jgi:hypothetical protein